MLYEGPEQVMTCPQTIQLGRDGRSKCLRIRWRQVGHSSELRVGPYALIRIQVGGIAGELGRPNSRVLGEESPHDLGAIMDVASIPDHGERSSKVTIHAVKEVDNVFAVDILVRWQQVKVQAKSLASRAYGNGADRGDPIPPIPAALNGRLASRSEGATYRWSEHEPRFV